MTALLILAFLACSLYGSRLFWRALTRRVEKEVADAFAERDKPKRIVDHGSYNPATDEHPW